MNSFLFDLIVFFECFDGCAGFRRVCLKSKKRSRRSSSVPTSRKVGCLLFCRGIDDVRCVCAHPGIEDKLEELKVTWNAQVFEFTPWKERGPVCLSGTLPAS